MKTIFRGKLHAVDILFIVITVTVMSLLFFSFFYKADTGGRPVLLTVRVTSDVPSIISQVPDQKKVYFDSRNDPVEYVRSEYRGNDFYITLKSVGKIESEKYIFDGKRVLLGEKAEIHSSYFAQGYITNVRYE